MTLRYSMGAAAALLLAVVLVVAPIVECWEVQRHGSIDTKQSKVLRRRLVPQQFGPASGDADQLVCDAGMTAVVQLQFVGLTGFLPNDNATKALRASIDAALLDHASPDYAWSVYLVPDAEDIATTGRSVVYCQCVVVASGRRDEDPSAKRARECSKREELYDAVLAAAAEGRLVTEAAMAAYGRITEEELSSLPMSIREALAVNRREEATGAPSTGSPQPPIVMLPPVDNNDNSGSVSTTVLAILGVLVAIVIVVAVRYKIKGWLKQRSGAEQRKKYEVEGSGDGGGVVLDVRRGDAEEREDNIDRRGSAARSTPASEVQASLQEQRTGVGRAPEEAAPQQSRVSAWMRKQSAMDEGLAMPDDQREQSKAEEAVPPAEAKTTDAGTTDNTDGDVVAIKSSATVGSVLASALRGVHLEGGATKLNVEETSTAIELGTPETANLMAALDQRSGATDGLPMSPASQSSYATGSVVPPASRDIEHTLSLNSLAGLGVVVDGAGDDTQPVIPRLRSITARKENGWGVTPVSPGPPRPDTGRSNNASRSGAASSRSSTVGGSARIVRSRSPPPPAPLPPLVLQPAAVVSDEEDPPAFKAQSSRPATAGTDSGTSTGRRSTDYVHLGQSQLVSRDSHESWTTLAAQAAVASVSLSEGTSWRRPGDTVKGKEEAVECFDEEGEFAPV